MKGILHFLAQLYPRSWRERYGAEFDALLEDASPRWQDLGDVVVSALSVQMRTWGFGKIAVSLALAGGLLGLAGSFALPEQYVSQALVGYEHADRTDPGLSAALRSASGRQILEEVILRQGLYERELRQKPMTDVIQNMKQAVDIRYPGPRTIEITFNYDDRYKAQRTLFDLVNLVRRELPDAEVRSGASLPQNPVEPNRLSIAGYGFGGGVLAAVVFGLFLRPVRLAAALGLTGAIVVWGVSEAIPQRYVSTALFGMRTSRGAASDREIDGYLQSLAGKVLDQISLTLLIERTRVYGEGKPTDGLIAKLRKNIRMERVPKSRGEIRVSFENGDPKEAQRVTALLTESIMRENLLEKPPVMSLDVIDPPSLPERPLGLVDRWSHSR